MMKNRRLAGAIADVSFFEIRRQFEYKANKALYVDRFDPTSKTCSVCNYKLADLPFDVRKWDCPECGASHDRDINAAINILRRASPEVKPADCRTNAKAGRMNREANRNLCMT